MQPLRHFLNIALVPILLALATNGLVRAEVFDRYTNAVLAQALQQNQLSPVQALTPDQINDAPKLIPNSNGALVFVKTANGFHAKLLVLFAQQKIGEQTLPVLVVERFVTYRPNSERAVAAEGRNLHLYPGFVLHLEIGQIVPANVSGHLRVVSDAKKGEYVEALGTTRMYLVTKPLPGTEVKKSARPAPDENYRIEFFKGTFRLFDDGRNSGILRLEVDEQGNLRGEFISDATGNKYPVSGKVGPNPRHAVQFTIQFPKSVQHFSGYIFTRGGQAICGSSKFQEREAGFYAIRTNED